uniref:DUF3466 family protein n=1 Tax=Ningiella ruwaisensis TaxID=2364274 RepID=UPI00109FE868|nr:DUF3466 family protein [Ningiella ruwaisensis]
MKLNKVMGAVALALCTTPLLAGATAYDVQELPLNDIAENQFATSIDNTGLILSTVQLPFNQPINMALFNVDSFTSLTDPDAAEAGQFNDEDYRIVVNTFRNAAAEFSLTSQKLAAQLAYTTDGVNANYVNMFDTETEETGGFTFGLNTSVAGSVSGAYIIGDGPTPFYTVDFTDADGNDITFNINDVQRRGFVQFGETVTPLMPIDDTFGGISVPRAINENLQVVGYSSVDIGDAITNAIEACQADDLEIPVEVCEYDRRRSIQSSFVTRATLWQLDAQGQVVSSQFFDLSFEPDEDDNRPFVNDALDINNSGIAVGSGIITFGDNGDRATNAAMIFENGLATRMLDDDDLLPNYAVGINDNNIIVGYQTQFINNVGRNKMFIYNKETGDLDFPSDFFVSSSTFPRDINNNGIVVGDAEVTSTSPRRRAGFVYDIEANTFLDLNTLIACDSPYSIIGANSINDDNTIVADATVLRAERNERGEVILDENGEEVLETQVVALKLTPNGEDAPECSPSEEEVAATERQGASGSVLMLLMLGAFALLRRKSLAK